MESWSSGWGHVWDVTHNCLWSKPVSLHAWRTSFPVQFWETVPCSSVTYKTVYTRKWLPPTKTKYAFSLAKKKSSFIVSWITFMSVKIAFPLCTCYSANLQATRLLWVHTLKALSFCSTVCLYVLHMVLTINSHFFANTALSCWSL
jgi:uncharacterized membrane protein (DUF485 family)